MLVDRENRRPVAEHLATTLDCLGQQSRFKVFHPARVVLWPVTEQSFLGRVTVNVEVETKSFAVRAL